MKFNSSLLQDNLAKKQVVLVLPCVILRITPIQVKSLQWDVCLDLHCIDDDGFISGNVDSTTADDERDDTCTSWVQLIVFLVVLILGKVPSPKRRLFIYVPFGVSCGQNKRICVHLVTYPMIPWVNRILSSSDHHLDGPSHDLVCFHSKSVEGVIRYSRA